MSFHDSWIAARGVTKEQMLDLFGLVETGEAGYAIEIAQPYAVGTTPDGWTILYANFNGLAHIDNVRELSRLGMVLACDFQDQVDAPSSLMIGVDQGEKLWEIGTADKAVTATGTLPLEFAAIHDHYAEKDEKDPDVAWVYDVPAELGKTLCGFRHDQDESVFLALRPRTDSRWHANLTLAEHPQSPPFDRPVLKERKRDRSDEMKAYALLALVTLFLYILAEALRELGWIS